MSLLWRDSATASFALLLFVFDSFGEIISVVALASDQSVEILEEDRMVPLWLVENLLANCGIQILEQREYLPHRQHDTLLLESTLEHASVYSLHEENTRLGSLQFIFLFLLVIL